MFHRSLPSRFWSLLAWILLPSINTLNAYLISYFFQDKNVFSGWDLLHNIPPNYVLSLFISVPIGWLSSIASEIWERGFHLKARLFCCVSGMISSFVLSYFLRTLLTTKTPSVSEFEIPSQFLLPIIWSFGLILTGFLLRTPQRT